MNQQPIPSLAEVEAQHVSFVLAQCDRVKDALNILGISKQKLLVIRKRIGAPIGKRTVRA